MPNIVREDIQCLEELHSALSIVFFRVKGYSVIDWDTYLAAVVRLNRFLGNEPEDDEEEDRETLPLPFVP